MILAAIRKSSLLFLVAFAVLVARTVHAEEPTVTDILAAGDSIWVATYEGLFIINNVTDQTTYMNPEHYGARLKKVRSIAKAQDNSLWIAVYDFFMKYSDGQWARVADIDFNPVYFTIYNEFIWATNSYDIFSFDGTSFTTYTPPFEWGASSCPPIKDITVDQDGMVWTVGCEGLAHVSPTDNTVVEDSRARVDGNKIIIDDEGIFWIATRNRGLLAIYTDATKVYYDTTNSPIALNNVQDIAFDSAGLCWLLVSEYWNVDTTPQLLSFDGISWIVYDMPVFPYGRVISCLEIDINDVKWISTDDGLWRFDDMTWKRYALSESVTAINNTESVPTEFSISPPFPNPFNAATRITVVLPETVDLDLSVYSITGQVVMNLARGRFSPGRHDFVFDAGGLSSGLYFCRLACPEVTATRKMLLVK